MTVKLNAAGERHASGLIASGKYDMDSSWDFSAEDGNKMLGGSGDDWAEYSSWHLGEDTAETDKTKARWKFPFGKDGKVYRRAVAAIRQRASQGDEKDIFDAAGRLMAAMDKKEGNAAAGLGVERRILLGAELRVAARADGKGMTISGYSAVFNTVTDLGPFREQIAPGCFSDSIGQDDVRALFNHDPNLVIGRNKAGTLRLAEDAKGLSMACDLPDTQFARDLATSIERGDISQQSFGFETLDDDWQMKDGAPLRTLKRVRLWDVSPVTFAAYPSTDVAMRRLAVSLPSHRADTTLPAWRLQLARRRQQLAAGT